MELTTAEAGAIVGLSDQAVRDHIAAGRLIARRHGVRGLFKIEAGDLRRFAREFDYTLDEQYLTQLTKLTAN